MQGRAQVSGKKLVPAGAERNLYQQGVSDFQKVPGLNVVDPHSV
jgi:hypothetical protein